MWKYKSLDCLHQRYLNHITCNFSTKSKIYRNIRRKSKTFEVFVSEYFRSTLDVLTYDKYIDKSSCLLSGSDIEITLSINLVYVSRGHFELPERNFFNRNIIQKFIINTKISITSFIQMLIYVATCEYLRHSMICLSTFFSQCRHSWDNRFFLTCREYKGTKHKVLC